MLLQMTLLLSISWLSNVHRMHAQRPLHLFRLAMDVQSLLCPGCCAWRCCKCVSACISLNLVLSRFAQEQGFPGGTGGKEPTCQCRRRKGHGFHPWVRKVPWRGKWQPGPVLLPGESRGQRGLAGLSSWGRRDRTRLRVCTRMSGVGLLDHICCCTRVCLPSDFGCAQLFVTPWAKAHGLLCPQLHPGVRSDPCPSSQ